jgi:DNA repair protein RadD
MQLRDYQIAALDDTYNYFLNETGNPLVVLPTGSGKSLTMAEWVRGVLTMDPRARILICTHVRELVAQNHAELMMLWPGAPAGIYSAGLRKRQLGSRILFCSVQSVHRRALQIQQCDMLLIDEAHLVPRDATTMYGRLIKELREINPAMKVIGYTATPYRMDQGLLHGPGEIFTHVAHETPVRLLIEQGYLVPLVSRSRKGVEINTTGVHTRLGEFVASELEEIALDPEVIER